MAFGSGDYAGWAARSVAERCAALRRLRDSLAADADALAEIISREIGKPLQEAYGADVLPSLKALDWLMKNTPRVMRNRRIAGRRAAWMLPEPYGVVGVIGTWNYPLFLNLTSIAWALAAGNTVMWKPSELAEASAQALACRMEAAGLPVTTVYGGAEAGRALCRAGCDKLAFTGSAATGRAILAELAAHGTPGVMELSGNDAMIVCADAPVKLAARSAVWGRISNAGQSCTAPQRIFVVQEVYDAFVAEAQSVMAALRPGIDYGPLRTEAIRRRAHQMVCDAVSRGARLLVGGRLPEESPGCFYPPTLLAECCAGMLLMEQDFFGPVLAVCRVADESEAVQRANACDTALGASVWTRRAARGRQIAAQLRAGFVAVNDILRDAADPALPFGGWGASGFGKQRGVPALEEFVRWKTVVSHGVGGARRHLFPYRPATLPILRGLIALRTAQGPAAKLRAMHALIRAAMRWEREK